MFARGYFSPDYFAASYFAGPSSGENPPTPALESACWMNRYLG